MAGFLYLIEGGVDESRFRSQSDGVRLLGRSAQEDVDAGDARRVRAMDGPSQSLSPSQSQKSHLRVVFFVTVRGRGHRKPPSNGGLTESVVRMTVCGIGGAKARMAHVLRENLLENLLYSG